MFTLTYTVDSLFNDILGENGVDSEITSNQKIWFDIFPYINRNVTWLQLKPKMLILIKEIIKHKHLKPKHLDDKDYVKIIICVVVVVDKSWSIIIKLKVLILFLFQW